MASPPADSDTPQSIASPPWPSPTQSTNDLTASPQPMTPSESEVGAKPPAPLKQQQQQQQQPRDDPPATISQLHSPLIVTAPSKYPDPGPRSALFDDHVAVAHVPGSIHLVPDSTIQRLVERQGYIPLIRQLAEDLAHRDRDLVNFRRRAEERERALKRMLLEVEVSNADIEKRLAACTLQRKPSRETMRSSAGGAGAAGDQMSYTESIDEMMHQALSEEDAFSMADDTSGLNIHLEEEIRDEMPMVRRATAALRSRPENARSLVGQSFGGRSGVRISRSPAAVPDLAAET